MLFSSEVRLAWNECTPGTMEYQAWLHFKWHLLESIKDQSFFFSFFPPCFCQMLRVLHICIFEFSSKNSRVIVCPCQGQRYTLIRLTPRRGWAGLANGSGISAGVAHFRARGAWQRRTFLWKASACSARPVGGLSTGGENKRLHGRFRGYQNCWKSRVSVVFGNNKTWDVNLSQVVS